MFKIFSWPYLAFVFLFFNIYSLAQDSATDTTVPAESKKTWLPVISIAQGLMNFSGDVGYNKLNQPLNARSGVQAEIQFPSEKKISFSLFFLSGKISGEEKTITRALNFKSDIMSGGFLFRFDFLSRKRSDQIFIPFIVAGAEYFSFNSKTDLLDKDGQAYQYWSDGTIRNISQNDPNAEQASSIYRDYIYETDLKKADLDDVENYPAATWGVPIGIGARLKLSDKFSMHFSSMYHLTGTDLIDGISSEGSGVRKGNSKKDNFIFSSVSLRFDLSSKKIDDYKHIDFNALVNEDSDGDGIPDLQDDSSGTPKNSNAVYADGKPFDKDNDGIPDYRDIELTSASDAVVDEQGVTITEAMIEEKFRKDSLEALPSVIEYLKSYDKLTQRNPDVEKRWIERATEISKTNAIPVPLIYAPVDIDKNGIISPKEISLAIDNYLAKRSRYSVSEFFDLIDFFFTQN